MKIPPPRPSVRLRALAAWLALTTVACAGSAPRPLNVLFITADDMNADSPGWMGNPLKATPRLDAFAATSHQFVNNFVTAPICQPSRSALMTGRVPHRSGALGFDPVREDVPTLVTILQARGYFTAGMNKLPHMQPKACFPWDLAFMGSGKNPTALAKQVTAAIAAAKKSGRPFFINCNIGDPHRPFFGSADVGKKKHKKAAAKGEFDDEPDAPAAREDTIVPFQPDEVPVPAFLEDVPGVRREVAQYYSSIRRMDVSFARVLQALDDSGEAPHTVVIFLGDHGMSFPFSKATVYFNGTWAPLLLRWPEMGPPQRRTEMTSSVDLLPTLLDVLGAPVPAGVDGRSWLPLLRGETQPDRDHVFTHVNDVSSGADFPQRCVRTRTKALIFEAWPARGVPFKVEAMSGLSYAAMAEAAASDPHIQARVDQYIKGVTFAFYDLEKDPAERRNEIDNPAYRAEIERLTHLLLGHMERTADPQLENFRAALAARKR
ncbi:MAG: sulfatase [Opitutae bacterium]|nr:sulfatase [Opitutae bacterium]